MSIKVLIDCFRKKSYNTRQEAWDRLGKKQKTFTVYKCFTCGRFHVAHNKRTRKKY